MLVAIFATEGQAEQAARALQRLEEDGLISVNGARIVKKDPEGTTLILRSYDTLPEGAMGASAIGTLIGMFAGPTGLAIGAAAGLLIGGTADAHNAHVLRDFVAQVVNSLEGGEIALVAQIYEESTSAVDEAMKAPGGVVFRRALSEVRDAAFEHEINAVRARRDAIVQHVSEKAHIKP